MNTLDECNKYLVNKGYSVVYERTPGDGGYWKLHVGAWFISFRFGDQRFPLFHAFSKKGKLEFYVSPSVEVGDDILFDTIDEAIAFMEMLR